MFGNVHIMHLINIYDIKNLNVTKSILKGLQGKYSFFCHSVDFLYSLGLEFVAPNVGNMCRKFSCNKTC
jgi:hypothetical protein